MNANLFFLLLIIDRVQFFHSLGHEICHSYLISLNEIAKIKEKEIIEK